MIDQLVKGLPEVYQPIFGYPQLSTAASRPCADRLNQIEKIYYALEKLLKRPLKVLDLGCAQGFFSLSLAQRGAVVHGVDYLEQNIALCKALAQEYPEFSISFTEGRIEDVVPTLHSGQYDLILGLSVFHHLIYTSGSSSVKVLLEHLAQVSGALVLEMALQNEPLYWGPAQPDDPRELLSDIAFVHIVGHHGTHLAEIPRPMFIASSRYLIFGEIADEFEKWTFESHKKSNNVHKYGRKYYFGRNYFVKYYKINQKKYEYNLKEFNNEVEFLENPAKNFNSAELVTYGINKEVAWVVMQKLPGSLLLDLILNDITFDSNKILLEILEKLASLEISGYYHSDLRTWNILVDLPSKYVHIIDYGAISRIPQDCVWPGNLYFSFLIFVQEITNKRVLDPVPLRSNQFSPFKLIQPYQSWAIRLFEKPMSEWSFVDLHNSLLEINENKILHLSEPLTPVWMMIQAMEDGIQIYSDHHDSLISNSKTIINQIQNKAIEAENKAIEAENKAIEAENKAIEAENKAIEAENKAIEAEVKVLLAQNELMRKNEHINKILNSNTWKYTMPIRYLNYIFKMLTGNIKIYIKKIVYRAIQEIKYRPKLRRMVKTSLLFLLNSIKSVPILKFFIKKLLKKFPKLYLHLYAFSVANKNKTENTNIKGSDKINFQANSIAPQFLDKQNERKNNPLKKGERILYYYVDHTVGCEVNTGMQRLVRELGRSFQENGELIYFVKWNFTNKELELINQNELEHLSQWNGPKINEDEYSSYPVTDGTSIVINKHNFNDANWLVVPEVTHINNHPEAVTLDIITKAKQLALKTVFVFYDATPIQRKELNDMAHKHEKYMQHLLLADLVVPISKSSTSDLTNFLIHHELATEITLPKIDCIPLSGESKQTSRITRASKSKRKLILSIGSITPHKNQIVLLEAFEKFIIKHPDSGWELELVGNIHHDLFTVAVSFASRNREIKFLGFLSDEELASKLKECSFTVFPSLMEGFGLPILESIWYGKPCICANFGAMAEVAEGGGCLMVDVINNDAIMSAIEELTFNSKRYLELESEAINRHMKTWGDYANDFSEALNQSTNLLNQIGLVYYWVDHTCNYNSNSGIQRVVRGLAQSLIEKGLKLIPIKWDDKFKTISPLTSDELICLSKWNGPSVDDWHKWRLPDISNIYDWLFVPELLSDPFGPSNFLVKEFAVKNGLRTACIFYDAIPWKMTEFYTQDESKRHAEYMRGLNQFDLILTISKTSLNDLVIYLSSLKNEKTINLESRIYPCLLPGEFKERERIIKTKVSSSETPILILCVSTIEPRKNHIKLIEAFKNVTNKTNKKIELCLVGGSPFTELAKQIHLEIFNSNNIRWEQNINDTRLRELYDLCDFTIYPSIEEGFGMPILESLWHARPVICSEVSAMGEVAIGGGCLILKTPDVESLEEGIKRLINDDNLRVQLGNEAILRPLKSWLDYANDVIYFMANERRLPVRQNLSVVIPVKEFNKTFINLTAQPLLSICISTYNRAEWLNLSLENIFRLLPIPQEDIEIIVCDNASTDNTHNIAKSYLNRSDFRCYKNNYNVGMLGNLRVTANHARGRHIWILGDDDLIMEGGINRVLNVLQKTPDISLIYINYAYTREENPNEINNLNYFFESSTPVVPICPDVSTTVKNISTLSDNFFTAIYCIIFRRDHALKAYSQNTEGRPFSTMLTSIPTTFYVLNYMMEEDAHWIGNPVLVVNLNVSWMRYAALWLLERLPETFDLAEKMGADSDKMDQVRIRHVAHFNHWLNDIYLNQSEPNYECFSLAQLLIRYKHIEIFQNLIPRLNEIYSFARSKGAKGTEQLPEKIFDFYKI
jgi:glycosyltransferase involved in cell wall biosynthesis/SAM-dependent methyltransferase